jgi:hypothetical protein
MQPTGNINVNEYRHQHRLRNVGAVRRVAVAALTTAMWKYHQLSHMNLDPLQNDTWKIPDNEDTTPSKPYNKIRVFYNLFVASADDEARVQAIVDEQMANLDHNLHDVNDSITMLGHMLPNVSSYMIRDHLEQGDEGETLHALWKYCKEHDNRQRKVVYLHSKGSFHPKPQNDKLRRFLTEGALSPECANLPDTCDVCSSRMSPLPHPHTPGNMWLARCDYVAKLVRHIVGQGQALFAFSIAFYFPICNVLAPKRLIHSLPKTGSYPVSFLEVCRCHLVLSHYDILNPNTRVSINFVRRLVYRTRQILLRALGSFPSIGRAV